MLRWLFSTSLTSHLQYGRIVFPYSFQPLNNHTYTSHTRRNGQRHHRKSNLPTLRTTVSSPTPITTPTSSSHKRNVPWNITIGISYMLADVHISSPISKTPRDPPSTFLPHGKHHPTPETPYVSRIIQLFFVGINSRTMVRSIAMVCHGWGWYWYWGFVVNVRFLGR